MYTDEIWVFGLLFTGPRLLLMSDDDGVVLWLLLLLLLLPLAW